jgi:Domain of unknown function (DUF4281)
MTAEQVFSISNYIALIGWIVLIVAGKTRWAPGLVTGTILPLLLGLLYTGLIVRHWGDAHGGFSTLAAVQSLFTNQWLLLAGWIHYLSFDLFIGSWQVRDAQKHGIPHLATVPGLILTFLFGPIGLLLFFAIRAAKLHTLTVGSRRWEQPLRE